MSSEQTAAQPGDDDLSLAAASGLTAAVTIHAELVAEDLGLALAQREPAS
jgi:hypothetical protein